MLLQEQSQQTSIFFHITFPRSPKILQVHMSTDPVKKLHFFAYLDNLTFPCHFH